MREALAGSARPDRLARPRRRSRAAGLYASADLYVWPAIGEAWGMALLEAQAAGLPVVVGRSGGIPDIVADGEAGILVQAGDARALALAVATLLDDGPPTAYDGEAPRKPASARATISAIGRAG